ncbi:phosphate acyltransferase [Mycoplasmopsis bovis]|uniref:Phosphate acetyltransferase n=3 Tax=Mycoplasmopsis bovis TaxID=28903 RepID=A0A059Y8U2_MYCBV|nr:phosphate acyltransferase [Mycoplasmopsis bovis]AEI90242.1 phosphate acetyltransferase (phosphotransacetylase) [Mycoplasmopsis bovis Hubei-1]AFM51921.1 phosphate acetyltransferase [Mycoplasmopsis bovis HB0801]AIA34106.1 phosphate acetyltransferase [Mycoplasmopsis bovis CQ-W70]AKO50723.1 phosphate acetyltransferase [Mycoplasmopsis bovis]AQU85820.1 phosphate acetyltransferase [Mycoplasmopsis bovis]
MHTTSKFSAYISSLLKEKCQKQILSVLFIDGDDKRAREAALYFKKNNLARPIMLLENESQVVDDGLENIILSKEEESIKAYADELVKIRNGKEDYETCLKNMHTRPYYGAMMIKLKDVDSAVGGLIYSTADILRAAFKCIGAKPGIKTISSVIVMHKDDEQLIFTDPSTVQKPSAEQLVDIAANAISFANMMNMNSLGAFLTYSTNNSGKGENPDLVREAVKIATERGLNVINGEMQFDSAYDLNVRKAKFPSAVQKEAGVFIFPNLESCNIGCKIAQRMGKYGAVGAILQGVNGAINDFSRGATVADVIDVTSITILNGYTFK